MLQDSYILIIDDNLADRKLILHAFSQFEENLNFTTIEDSETAIQYIEKANVGIQKKLPDLIILDLNMPRISGIEVLVQLKNHPRFSCIPVVIFSSSEAPADVKNAYENNANSYIVKPCDYKNFSNAIKQIWEFWFTISRLPKGC